LLVLLSQQHSFSNSTDDTCNLPSTLLMTVQSSPGAVLAHPEKSNTWLANLCKAKLH
jgi:hypothetical protein